METIYTVFNEVLVLLVIMGVGILARKINILTDEVVKHLSELLLKVTAPLLIVSSFMGKITLEILANASKVFIIALLIHLFAIVLSSIFLFKNKSRKSKVIKLAMAFSNCGFMGIPVMATLFGDEGVIYASLYMLAYNVFVWTYGIKTVSDNDRGSIKKVLLNPGLFSILIGGILVLLKIQVPYFIQKPALLLGEMTTPLSMLIIGSLISKTKVKDIIFDKQLYLIGALRLLIIPLALSGIFLALKVQGVYVKSLILLVGMPVGTIVAILAEKYGFEAIFTSKLVGFTTVLSIITIPIVATFVSYFF